MRWAEFLVNVPLHRSLNCPIFSNSVPVDEWFEGHCVNDPQTWTPLWELTVGAAGGGGMGKGGQRGKSWDNYNRITIKNDYKEKNQKIKINILCHEKQFLPHILFSLFIFRLKPVPYACILHLDFFLQLSCFTSCFQQFPSGDF